MVVIVAVAVIVADPVIVAEHLNGNDPVEVIDTGAGPWCPGTSVPRGSGGIVHGEAIRVTAGVPDHERGHDHGVDDDHGHVRRRAIVERVAARRQYPNTARRRRLVMRRSSPAWRRVIVA